MRNRPPWAIKERERERELRREGGQLKKCLMISDENTEIPECLQPTEPKAEGLSSEGNILCTFP